uniref:KTx type I n=1 Tax=Calliactis polypus TaxID=656064 RepID=KTX1_CALPY
MKTTLVVVVLACIVALTSALEADLLSHESCRYISSNRYCGHDYMDKLCNTTCNCKDVLSEFSCGVLKKDGQCNKADIQAKCKLTCDKC